MRQIVCDYCGSAAPQGRFFSVTVRLEVADLVDTSFRRNVGGILNEVCSPRCARALIVKWAENEIEKIDPMGRVTT